jgi:ABC-type phosphate/phosphonate transport system substrate-binding protein
MMKRSALALALSFAVLARAEDLRLARASAVRKLAVTPFYAPEQMWRLYAPFVDHLRRETGEAWELSLHPSHEALIEELCAGRVDVALVGPMPLGRIHRKCEGAPFLVALGPGGVSTYQSVLVTADPAVTAISALRGKDVGLFRGSTAAHAIPVKLLADAGLPPGSYRPVWLEGQDRLMAAVLAGRISAAGVKSALYRRFEKEPGLRQLGTSGPLPNFAFAALPSLPARTRDRFAAALLPLRPRERSSHAQLVSSWDDEVRHGFVRPPPEYLPSVLALLETVERLPREPG